MREACACRCFLHIGFVLSFDAGAAPPVPGRSQAPVKLLLSMGGGVDRGSMLGATYSCSVLVVDADHASRRRLVDGLSAEGLGFRGRPPGWPGEQACRSPATPWSSRCPARPYDAPIPGHGAGVGDFPIVILGAAPDEVQWCSTPGRRRGGRPALRRRWPPGCGGAAAGRNADAEEPPGGRAAGDRGGARPARRAVPRPVAQGVRPAPGPGRREGRVASRRNYSPRFGRAAGGPDKTLDVHLSWLRRKLGESGRRPLPPHGAGWGQADRSAA